LSSNASEEKEIFRSGQVQTPSTSHWTRHSGPDRSIVHAFRGGPRGQKGNEAPHNKWSFQSKLFPVLFSGNYHTAAIGYYHGHLDRIEYRPSRLRPKCLRFLL